MGKIEVEYLDDSESNTRIELCRIRTRSKVIVRWEGWEEFLTVVEVTAVRDGEV